MRASVQADLATAAHNDAAQAAFDAHETRLAAACERVMRRATRMAVEVFTAHQRLNVVASADPGWRRPLAGDLFDDAAIQAELETLAEKSRTAAASETAERMSIALGIDFDQRNRLLDHVIAGQSGMNIVTAPADLARSMMESLQESYDAGLSIPHAARDMRKAGYKHSKYYAERIARTELIAATNAASLATVKGGTTIPYKLWMSTGDNRTRPSHRDAEGQVRKLDDAFTVGGHYLMYPGDPSGPADEVVMCRCTMGYSDSLAASAASTLHADREDSMAATDTTVGAGWAGTIAQEGVDTGDGRRIEPGALAWRELPLTLMAQHTTPDFGGHAEAQVAGRIDTLARMGANIAGTGVFDTGEWGAETERMVRDGMLKGISIDLAINEAEIIPAEGVEDEIEAYFLGTLNVLDGTILGATIVPFPAFENATIAIVAGGSMRLSQFRREDVDGVTRTVATFHNPFIPDVALTASGNADPAPVEDYIADVETALDKLRARLEARG